MAADEHCRQQPPCSVPPCPLVPRPTTGRPHARRAQRLLRQHDVKVTYDALTDAVGKGDPGVVAALLTAGLQIDGPAADRASNAVINGLASACNLDPVPATPRRALPLATHPGIKPQQRGHTMRAILHTTLAIGLALAPATAFAQTGGSGGPGPAPSGTASAGGSAGTIAGPGERSTTPGAIGSGTAGTGTTGTGAGRTGGVSGAAATGAAGAGGGGK